MDSHPPAAGALVGHVTTPGAIRVGTAPVNWNNDDLAGWRPTVPFRTILAEAAAAGYSGIEYGPDFPSDPVEVRSALAANGLLLAGGYRWLRLRDDSVFATELPALERLLDRLAAAGGQDLIVADAMSPARIAMAGQVPEDGSAGLDATGWRRLGSNLRRVAALAQDKGVRTHYHNHVGSFVETPAEVERLLEELRPGLVDLCFDTGHFAYGGGDPTRFIRERGELIGYLHLKDVDAGVLVAARRARLGFLDALRRYIFCEFGAGLVDIPGAIGALRDSGFVGWVIVEQDTSERPAAESAAASRRFLRDRCDL